MANLFSKIIITDALRNLEIPDIESKVAILKDWLDMYNSGNLQKKSEKEFE
jgi:transcription elongation factor Elf1